MKEVEAELKIASMDRLLVIVMPAHLQTEEKVYMREVNLQRRKSEKMTRQKRKKSFVFYECGLI